MNKIAKVAFVAMAGFFSAMHAMDLRLDLWKNNPRDLRPADFALMQRTIGSSALTRLCPDYDQYWAFVGLLCVGGQDRQAQNYCEHIMPRKTRDTALRATLQQIETDLRQLLANKHWTIGSIIHAWASFALLRIQNAPAEKLVTYYEQILAKIPGARFPQGYHPRVPLCEPAGDSRPTSPEPVPGTIPAATRRVLVQPPSALSVDDDAGPRGEGADQGSVMSSEQAARYDSGDEPPVDDGASGQPRQRIFGNGHARHASRQEISPRAALDAVGIMLARLYNDVYEREINHDDLLANLAFIRRIAVLRAHGRPGSAPVRVASTSAFDLSDEDVLSAIPAQEEDFRCSEVRNARQHQRRQGADDLLRLGEDDSDTSSRVAVHDLAGELGDDQEEVARPAEARLQQTEQQLEQAERGRRAVEQENARLCEQITALQAQQVRPAQAPAAVDERAAAQLRAQIEQLERDLRGQATMRVQLTDMNQRLRAANANQEQAIRAMEQRTQGLAIGHGPQAAQAPQQVQVDERVATRMRQLERQNQAFAERINEADQQMQALGGILEMLASHPDIGEQVQRIMADLEHEAEQDQAGTADAHAPEAVKKQ